MANEAPRNPTRVASILSAPASLVRLTSLTRGFLIAACDSLRQSDLQARADRLDCTEFEFGYLAWVLLGSASVVPGQPGPGALLVSVHVYP